VSAQQENVWVVVPEELHGRLVAQVYEARGYEAEESRIAAEYAGLASRHGIKTHAALKALHLEHLFGSSRGLAKGGANIQVIDTGFDAVVKINANYKLGQPVARFAMATCMKLADKHGVGVAAVDQPFHYLWGGGYVMEAALKGYIAYTNCTATLAEVVPFLGTYPTIGTNPHSWAFPTQEVVGFPVIVDWATSAVAMGRVQQLKREGKPLPPEVAIDKDGQFTQDPDQVFALMPFGGKLAGHKGYGLGLINEALAAGSFADGKARQANVKAVIEDILGHGNDRAILPGQLEHEAAELSRKHGGLLFSENEIKEFAAVFQEAGVKGFAPANFRRVKM
jgi:L-2-hydroxycarboxylate dehydrogenase (NAD+)